MNRFWQEHKALRDLIDLLFITEYELYKPFEERSDKAKAINDGEMLIAMLTVILVPADEDLHRFQQFTGRPVSEAELQEANMKGHAHFTAFEAMKDEEMIPGVKDALRPQLSLLKMGALENHLWVHGLRCQDTPSVFGFLQVYVENADQSTTIPWFVTPATIRCALYGVKHTDIPSEFGDLPEELCTPFSIDALLL